jgi:hypothetical protein
MIYFLAMNAKTLRRGILLFVLCVLAAEANYFINVIARGLKIPLFLDTLFSCVLAFAAGPAAGIMATVFTVLHISVIRGIGHWSFAFCGLAEVLLICLLKPRVPSAGIPRGERGAAGRWFLPGGAAASFISAFASLLILYAASCVTVSVMGGITDFILYEVLAENKLYYSPEDTFKIGFLRGGSPVMLTNILSRIPINIVDRFIVIFGGFSLSLLAGRINNLARRFPADRLSGLLGIKPRCE